MRFARHQNPARRYRTAFEPLEPRQLLTGAINTAFSFGSTKDDAITGIAVDANNITYVTGTFTGTITASTGGGNFSLVANGGTDVFVAAFNGNSLVWAHSFGGTGNDTSGDIVLTGNSLWIDGTFRASMDANTDSGTNTLLSNGAGDAYLSHFSTNGAFLNSFSFGGTGEDSALKIAADSAGQVFLLGSFSGTADLNPAANGTAFRTASNPNGNAFVSKVSTTGNLIWANTYAFNDSLLPADIAVAPNGIPVFAGTFKGTLDIDGTQNGSVLINSTRYLGFVAIMNLDGSFRLANTIGQPLSGNSDPIRIQALALDPVGNILLGGKFSGPIDLNPSPAVAAVSTLPELANATGDDAFEGFVLKLNANAAYIWSGALHGNGASEVNAIASDLGGGVFIAGDLQKTTDFDFSAIDHTLTAPATATRSSFITKYDNAGHWLWSNGATAGTGVNLATAITVTNDFRPVVAGTFNANTSFSTTTTGLTPVVSTTALVSNGLSDPFLLNFLPATIAPTSVLLTPATSTISRGNAAFLTLTIAGPSAPAGTITFFEGVTNLGTFPLAANTNKVTVPLQLLTPGNHTLLARYNGDANYAVTNSNAVNVTVILPQQPVGSIDSTGPGQMKGWVADYQSLNSPVVIQIFIDDQLRMALTANQNRPDLAGFLLGSTAHGFTFQLPQLLPGDHPVKIIGFDPATNAGATIATATLHSDNVYFDERYYRTTYPDIDAAIKSGKLASAWQHFITTGAREGRNPSAAFNELAYRQANPDVAAAVANGTLASGFAHFNASGAKEGRNPSPFFDSSFYLTTYPDVATAISSGAMPSAFAHFLLAGMFENRRPTPSFDPAAYLATHPAVATSIANGTTRSAWDDFVANSI